jgi:hypothetical protein
MTPRTIPIAVMPIQLPATTVDGEPLSPRREPAPEFLRDLCIQRFRLAREDQRQQEKARRAKIRRTMT